jgi:alkaline phosphatase
MAQPAPGPTNVIVMIGDGMGPQQVGLLEALHRVRGLPPSAMHRLAESGTTGLSLHHPADGLVTDSACSATQLATGVPSRNGMIGVNADGADQPNLRETAAALGMATGVVSDTRITHATPASFLAHVPYRSQELDIAAQIVGTDVDVALSGGRSLFVPEADGGARDDGRDLLAEAREAGFEVVTSADELSSAGPRVLGLFGERGMFDALQAPDHPEVPTLAALTQAALDRLDDDPDGFLLVIEGGQIDWAAHANDAAWMLAELRRFDAAVAVAHAFAEERGDTLLVVTADHETGGFGISPSERMPHPPLDLPGLDAPYDVKESPVPIEVFEGLEQHEQSVFAILGRLDQLPEAEQTPEALVALVDELWHRSLPLEVAQAILAPSPMEAREGHYGDGGYARAGALAQAFADETGMVWSTAGHTHTPVPVFAFGPGAERFGGLRHHVEIGQRLAEALPAAP